MPSKEECIPKFYVDPFGQQKKCRFMHDGKMALLGPFVNLVQRSVVQVVSVIKWRQFTP